MLTLLRYPSQAILFEYGNTLELLYYRQVRNHYEFHIFVNNVLVERYYFQNDTYIDFEDDNVEFKFRIESRGVGDQARKITIWCPNFVNIRRKEIPPKPRNVR